MILEYAVVNNNSRIEGELLSLVRLLEVPQLSRMWFPRNATYHDNDAWRERRPQLSKANKYCFGDAFFRLLTLEAGVTEASTVS